jgi:MinD superfamily P-loop ATPase
MPEITIISGKGGTGKTTLTGAFAHLAHNHVICDLDVDAPDLHLLLNPEIERDEDFYSGHLPRIDSERCTDCGECARRCRFEAVVQTDDGPAIDAAACEGCKVCVHFCPVQAIDWNQRHCGQWFVSRTRFGPMVHAQLFPGQENSGRLVALLRQQAKDMADADHRNLILSDGTPGIGCPVISSLTGTDLAVIVTEPTPSGRHDLERVADLCAHFGVPAAVIVNKADLNPEMAARVESEAQGRGLESLGRLDYDPAFTKAMVDRRVLTEYAPDSPTAKQIEDMWARILELAAAQKAA